MYCSTKISRLHQQVYNCNSFPEVQMELLKTEEWEKNYNSKESQDLDWVKFTIYSFVRLYESYNLKKKQTEVWCNTNVWSLIDNAFNDVEDFKAIRGEKSTVAGNARKNKNRSIGSTETMQRSATGSKCDLIFRDMTADHETVLEYGVGEAGTKAQGTKQIVEAGVKLPKILKDMLDQLIVTSHYKHQSLSVYGVQHSGLSVSLW